MSNEPNLDSEYPEPEMTEGDAWEHWHQRAIALDATAFRLRQALREIIDLDHHNHGPERRATKIARAALVAEN